MSPSADGDGDSALGSAADLDGDRQRCRRQMVIGLTEEEYWDALKQVRDKQRALEHVRLVTADGDSPIEDDEVEEAVVVYDDMA